MKFQSTHPLRGATQFGYALARALVISIHAPLAGCDPLPRAGRPTASDFNPRTPCGVRRSAIMEVGAWMIFQSTHPLRGATSLRRASRCRWRIFQSTHPLRGATVTSAVQPLPRLFQSTHPLRGATSRYRSAPGFLPISIHAPLAGCDHPPPVQIVR